MTEQKFTPGPWTVDGAGRWALVRGADMAIVATRHRLPGDVHEANARLIAAAPKMLAALEQVARYCDVDTDPIIRATAMAAIAEATGQS